MAMAAAAMTAAPCAARTAAGAQAAPSTSSSSSSSVSLPRSSLWGFPATRAKPLVLLCTRQQQQRRTRLPATSTAILLDEPEESEADIEAAYQALYGPAFGGAAKSEREERSGQDEEEEGGGRRGRRGRGGGDDDRPGPRGGGPRGGPKEFEERVVQIRRVTKVVKGGKQLSFRAVVVIGDKKGRVGVGVGKAKEVIAAVQKSVADAKRHLVTVPMTKYLTFPHRWVGWLAGWLLGWLGS